jgi:hypothetical protein
MNTFVFLLILDGCKEQETEPCDLWYLFFALILVHVKCNTEVDENMCFLNI